MVRILVGVTGGVAAYKALEVVRLLTKAGHSVRVLQTETSLNFVGKASFEAITGAPVLISEFERDPMRGAFPDQPLPEHEPISHLELVKAADLYLIAPATANSLAKLAQGMADNILTAAALAASCPVLVSPAMNNQMYEHPATQANIIKLRERGVAVIKPATGQLASKGEEGIGRLPEPAELVAACEAQLQGGVGKPLDGLSVLITAGGTREPIDSVRYIGNRSSGRMGYALADEASARGADVTVIAANISLPQSDQITYIEVETAAQLRTAALEYFPTCDLLLMSAAVADYRPPTTVTDKIKKDRVELKLELERTEDILCELSALKSPEQTVVGFAAEHGERAVEYGQQKLEQKRLDLVVVNDIGREEIAFDSENNEVTLLSSGKTRAVPLASKREIAGTILDHVMTLRAERSSSGISLDS